MTAVLYRFEDYLCGDEYSVEVKVHLREFEVLRTTPCGAWIEGQYGRKRFVLKDSRKRYAHPTVDEARESFIARKKRQLSIYQARARTAERALEIARGDILMRVA